MLSGICNLNLQVSSQQRNRFGWNKIYQIWQAGVPILNLSPSPSQPLIASNSTNSCIIPKFKIDWTGSVGQFQIGFPSMTWSCFLTMKPQSPPRTPPANLLEIQMCPVRNEQNGKTGPSYDVMIPKAAGGIPLLETKHLDSSLGRVL